MNQSTSNNTTFPDFDIPDLSNDYPIGSQNGSSDEDLDYLYKNYQDIIEFTEDYIFVSKKIAICWGSQVTGVQDRPFLDFGLSTSTNLDASVDSEFKRPYFIQSDDKVMAIVYTFIFIIGVCANLVVIIVIGLDPQVRTKSSLLYAFNLGQFSILSSDWRSNQNVPIDIVLKTVQSNCWLYNASIFTFQYLSSFTQRIVSDFFNKKVFLWKKSETYQ